MMFRMKILFSKTRDFVYHVSHENSLVNDTLEVFMSDLVKTRQLHPSLTETEVQNILHALEFAAEKHKKQSRQNIERTPYIVHPLQVAHYLLNIGRIDDAEVLMAAILHDTVEDTETTFEEIQGLFGYHVQQLVQEMTDDKSLSKQERKRLQIQRAPTKSEKAALIVLADKLSNLRDMTQSTPVGWDEERLTDYFLWAQEVIRQLPITNDYLLNAVEEVLESFWRKKAEQEYD